MSEQAKFLLTVDSVVAQQNQAPQPLFGQGYLDSHTAFEAASTQQPQVRHAIEQRIVELSDAMDRPIRIASLGCGSGMLDLPILVHCEDLIESFVGVDPNRPEIETFVRMLELHGPLLSDRVLLLAQTAEKFFDSGQKNLQFDLVLCAHALYYVADRRSFITNLLEITSPGGQLLIAHAPFGEMNALAQAFWHRQGVAPFYNSDLRTILDGLSILYTETAVDGMLALSLTDPTTPQGRLILEFVVQSQWATLGQSTQAAVLDYLAGTARGDFPQKYLDHPAAVFTIDR